MERLFMFACVFLFWSVFNTGLYLLMDKFGIISFYEVHSRRWMDYVIGLHCSFCFFIRLAAIELCIMSMLNLHLNFVIIAPLSICSAVISRKLF